MRLDLRRERLGQHEVARPGRPERRSSRTTTSGARARRRRARTVSAAARPRSARARTGRPPARAGRARRRARPAGGVPRPRATARSGSGTSGSRTGTPASARPSSACSSSSTSIPSSVCGTATISAPRLSRIFSGRSYVGASTRTRSPFRAKSSARKTNPWSDPFVTTTRSGLDSVALRDPLPKGRVARRRTVREHRRIALDRRLRAVRELLDRDAFGRRHAASERDRLHGATLGSRPDGVQGCCTRRCGADRGHRRRLRRGGRARQGSGRRRDRPRPPRRRGPRRRGAVRRASRGVPRSVLRARARQSRS